NEHERTRMDSCVAACRQTEPQIAGSLRSDSCVFVSIRGLTQFPFLKQQHSYCERRADITHDIGKGFAHIIPMEGAPTSVQRVREPEKLPIRRHGVKYRCPPGASVGWAAEKVIGHDSEQEKPGA